MKFQLMSLASALVLTVSSPAIAQEQADSAAPVTATAPVEVVSYSDAEIDAYADVALEIAKVSQEMAPAIQQTEDQAQKQQMFQQMQQRMIGIVEQSEDISVPEYNEISQAARQDESLAQRIVMSMKAQHEAEMPASQ